MKSHVLEKYSLSEKDIGSCCRFPGRHSQVVALFSYMTKCGLGIPIFCRSFLVWCKIYSQKECEPETGSASFSHWLSV